jgi:toxin YoeB
MGKYFVEVKETARKELVQIKKSGNKADIKKIERVFKELAEHPVIGTGKPEQLKYDLTGYWSRRINKKDRLIYIIDEKQSVVIVVSAKGHYF